MKRIVIALLLVLFLVGSSFATVPSSINRVSYTGNGSLTTYAYSWLIYDEDHLKVYVDEVLQTISTHYTVTNVGESGGGNVEFITAPGSTLPVLILRAVPLTQLADYVNLSAFDMDTLEQSIDLLCMMAQQFSEELGRSLTFSTTSTFSDVEMPDPVAERYLYSPDGATLTFAALATTSLTVTSFMETVLDDATPLAALQTLKSMFASVISKSANYNVAVADHGKLIEVDATGGNRIQGLPTVADAGDGFAVAIRKVDSGANTVTIDGSGAETVDSAANVVLRNQWSWAILVCNGTEWKAIHNIRKHDIDSTYEHAGVSGAVEDNFISFDANGLPQDSGQKDTDYQDASTDYCKIKSGNYTGDGETSQGITGIGFRPMVVWIFVHLTDAVEVFVKTDQFGTDKCYNIQARTFSADQLISLDADGFTVDDGGADAHPNKNAQVYDYIAWGN